MCICNPSISSPYCAKCRPDATFVQQINNINPISEAEVYMTYGRIDQAIQVLQDGLLPNRTFLDEEHNSAILLVLLSCYMQKKDRESFSNTIDRLGEIVDGESAAWHTATEMAKQFGLMAVRTDMGLQASIPAVNTLQPRENVEAAMKQIVIARLIDLGNQTKLPGFDDSVDKLNAKFNNMPDDLLLTFFELIVVQSHKAGFQ